MNFSLIEYIILKNTNEKHEVEYVEQKREKFSSSLTVFFATLSSAVGLGNIWMFPYVVGQNGGAAFIIIYLGCVLIIGLPTLISEFAIGRGTRKNVFRATRDVGSQKGIWGNWNFIITINILYVILLYSCCRLGLFIRV